MIPSLVQGCLIHPYDYFIIAILILGIVIGIGIGLLIAKYRR